MVEVRPATRDEIEDWNTYVKRSNQGTIFHRYEWLEVSAEHSPAELHTYVGVKGDTVVGLFPFYTMKKGPFTLVFSPLPGTGVPFLGPALLLDPNIKQRKREKSNKRFIDAWLKALEEKISPSYMRLITVPAYKDVRPFLWSDFSVSPEYTYRIDTTGTTDEIMSRFSGDARKSIRNTDEGEYMIREGDLETVEFVWRRISRRFEEQSKSYTLSKAYLEDVYRTLPNDQIATFEGFVDGERLSGRISLLSQSASYLWQGSPKPDVDTSVPINDLLNWATIQETVERDIPQCDQVGANYYRISQYKSKFNPNLVQYNQLTKGTLPAKAALKLYQRVRDK